MQRPALLVSISLLALLGLAACDTADPISTDAAAVAKDGRITPRGTPDDPRGYRPILLSEHDGQPLPRLRGAVPEDLVAFAYDASEDAFVQIPVQVDERDFVPLMKVYRSVSPQECWGNWCTPHESSPVPVLGYTDPDGLAGPDFDPTFDGNDEIALLLADFGDPAQGIPAGVVASSATEVEAQFDGATRYAYLFRRSDPNLDPAAGRNHVEYHFETVNPAYDIVGERAGDFQGRLTPTDHGVSNPERTWVETESYRLQFADRWIMDYLAVGPVDNRSPDLLTVDMVRFTQDPTNSNFNACLRWAFTGSVSEGGFLVNRDGPIRGIRHAIGLNSGPLMGFTWIFYPHGYESEATMRIHRTSHGVAFFYHMADTAEGYTYGYGTGVGTSPITDIIDGMDPGFGHTDLPAWQTVTAPNGAFGWATTFDLETDIPFYRRSEQPRLFYTDDLTSNENCDIDDVTGSNYREARTFYRGAHGVEVPYQTAWGPGTGLEIGGMPNTDPRHADLDRPLFALSLKRTYAFGTDPAVALAALQRPLAVATRPAR